MIKCSHHTTQFFSRKQPRAAPWLAAAGGAGCHWSTAATINPLKGCRRVDPVLNQTCKWCLTMLPKSSRRHLLAPYPCWKHLLVLSHLIYIHYYKRQVVLVGNLQLLLKVLFIMYILKHCETLLTCLILNNTLVPLCAAATRQRYNDL